MWSEIYEKISVIHGSRDFKLFGYAVLLLVLLVVIQRLRSEGESEEEIQTIVGVALFGVPASWLIFQFLLWPAWMGRLLEWISDSLQQSTLLRLVTLAVCVALSMLLLFIKSRSLFYFGILEGVGGLYTAWFVLSLSHENGVVAALGLGGSIFLMQNGYENFLNGMFEHKLESDRERRRRESSRIFGGS